MDGPHKQLRRRLFLSLGLNLFLAITLILSFGTGSRTCTLLGGNALANKSASQAIAEPYSPAQSAIEYEYRTYIRNDTRFTGYPDNDWEDAMHEILSGTLIRVSDEELRLDGTKSLPVKSGGYAAGLGVAHNLHCVKKLKQWMYREHFYPHLEAHGTEFDVIRDHADHCLDFLRQSVLCHIDYALYTLHWDPEKQSLLHGYPTVQKCVNWDKLHAWMEIRAVSTSEFAHGHE